MTDDEILTALRSMWRAVDPVPIHLADQVLLAVELEDLDQDFELLGLREVVGAAGYRGADAASTMIFGGGDDVTVTVTVSAGPGRSRRVDGWVDPPAALRVEARGVGGTARTVADDTGRFSFPELDPGLVRLVLLPADDADTGPQQPFVTPAVEI
jgi:hypothetical protein